MRPLQLWTVILVVTSNLLGCGGNDSPTAPTGGDFPVNRSGCSYYIGGLENHVVDATAARLEARVTIGEPLGVFLLSCGTFSSSSGPFEWTSTRPTVLEVHPIRFGTDVATLGAKQPGQSQLFLDFEADDGKRYRTTLGYCPENDSAFLDCQGLRKIDVVTVVR